MKLVKIKYTGKKSYTDKTAMRNEWAEGDVKQVLENDAKQLTKFAEFQVVHDKKAEDAERLAAEKALKDGEKDKDQKPKEKTDEEIAHEQALLQEQARLDDEKQRERDQRENMLREVEGWNKEALIEYGAKYHVNLSKQSKVADLRMEVSNLIETQGVR